MGILHAYCMQTTCKCHSRVSGLNLTSGVRIKFLSSLSRLFYSTNKYISANVREGDKDAAKP